MEFMQTVWTHLTMPNEGLIGIIFNSWGIPFIFIEAFVNALLFTQVLGIKYTKKQLFIYVLSISIISSIVNTFLGKPYSTYINMIVGIILIISIFKTKLLNGILSEFITIIVTVVLETIYCKICTVLFDMEYEELYSIPLTRLFITTLIYISIYLIYKIIKYYKINIILIENMNIRTKFILILNSTFAIIVIAMQIYMIVFYMNVLPFSITLLSVITLIIYFSISIFSLLKATKLEVTNKSLEEAQMYNKTLEMLHENLRIVKHDYANTLQSIDGYIINDDMNGLKRYFRSVKKEYDNLNNLTALNPSLVNDPALYSLIASKYHLAEENDITFNISILENFDKIQTSPYILTRILGILLDNAIEAAKDTKEKEIFFEVNGLFGNSTIKRSVISIQNSYANKDVDVDKIREKGYTSKETDKDSHGLGLWEVNKILKKSKNLNLYTTKNDKYFIQQLEIYDI